MTDNKKSASSGRIRKATIATVTAATAMTKPWIIRPSKIIITGVVTISNVRNCGTGNMLTALQSISLESEHAWALVFAQALPNSHPLRYRGDPSDHKPFRSGIIFVDDGEEICWRSDYSARLAS